MSYCQIQIYQRFIYQFTYHVIFSCCENAFCCICFACILLLVIYCLCNVETQTCYLCIVNSFMCLKVPLQLVLNLDACWHCKALLLFQSHVTSSLLGLNLLSLLTDLPHLTCRPLLPTWTTRTPLPTWLTLMT